MNKLAVQIATYFERQNLVEARLTPILAYKLECWMGTALWLSFALVIALLTHLHIEIFSFVATLTVLRKHMGGWHANNPWTCQVLSAVSVLSAVFIFAPLLYKLSGVALLSLSAFTNVTSAFLQPAYPLQLHLNESEVEAHIKIKNRTIIALSMLQLVLIFAGIKNVVVYILLAQFITLASVLISQCSAVYNDYISKTQK